MPGVIRAPYAVYDNRFATGYYRLLPDGRLLWGGRISTQEQPRDLAGLMRRDLALVYPQLADVAVDYAWSGRMGFARHKMPLIRELAPGLWVNSCFGGHGLNTTTLGGELVASALVEGDRRHKLLAPFAPRWVGGAFGPLAAQAIYGRARIQDAARAWRDRRRSEAVVHARSERGVSCLPSLGPQARQSFSQRTSSPVGKGAVVTSGNTQAISTIITSETLPARHQASRARPISQANRKPPTPSGMPTSRMPPTKMASQITGPMMAGASALVPAIGAEPRPSASRPKCATRSSSVGTRMAIGTRPASGPSCQLLSPAELPPATRGWR